VVGFGVCFGNIGIMVTVTPHEVAEKMKREVHAEHNHVQASKLSLYAGTWRAQRACSPEHRASLHWVLSHTLHPDVAINPERKEESKHRAQAKLARRGS
jgi:hypothetical protein